MTRRETKAEILANFDILPEINKEALSFFMKIELNKIKQALSKTVSAHQAGTTSWPSKAVCESLLREVQSFREIARRSARALNFRVIREMDNRRRKLLLGATIQKLANAINEELKRSVFSELRSKLVDEEDFPTAEKKCFVRVRRLILKRESARPDDLPLLLQYLPNKFKGLRSKLKASEIQDLLHLCYKAELADRSAIRPAIDLINKIGTPVQKQQVAGLSPEQIGRQKRLRHLARGRARTRRSRAKKNSRSPGVTHH